MKENGIILSRDVLADIDAQYPEIFDKIVEKAINEKVAPIAKKNSTSPVKEE